MPSLMIIIIAISILSLPIQSHQRKLTGLHQHYERKKRARWKKLRKYDPSLLPLSWYTINNKPDIKDNKKKNSNMNKNNDTDPDHMDSDDMNNNDKREINCDTFIGNGGIYAVLESYAGVLLRGMNLMSSDDIDKQNQGIQLYQDQLYPIMSDSFTWENLDGGTVISNKQELIDNALTLANAIPNSFGLESFGWFECDKKGKKITMTMHFNAKEQWDDPQSEIPRKDGGQPDIIQRYWNAAMYFEWDNQQNHFKITKYTYDDPLTENE